MITECSMADNIAAEAPATEFLENIHEALVRERFEVTVEPAIIERARLAVQRMIDLPPPERRARYDLVKARHHVDVELI